MSPEDRLVQHRLGWFRHAEEITRSVAKTCRYYGISRTRYYRWLNRYRELGAPGLRDRSSRPHSSPRATASEIVDKVLYLRRYYHFGPSRIRMYLHRYHTITLSHGAIWRILKRAGVNRLPSNMRYRRHQERFLRYEKPLPGHQLQVDVKFLAPVPGRPPALLPVHRDRRLHAGAGPQDLRAQYPAHGHHLHRRGARQTPLRGGVHPN